MTKRKVKTQKFRNSRATGSEEVDSQIFRFQRRVRQRVGQFRTQVEDFILRLENI